MSYLARNDIYLRSGWLSRFIGMCHWKVRAMPRLVCLWRYTPPRCVLTNLISVCLGYLPSTLLFFNAVVTIWNVLHNLDPLGLSDLITDPFWPTFLLRSGVRNLRVLSALWNSYVALIKVADTKESNSVELYLNYSLMLWKCDEC